MDYGILAQEAADSKQKREKEMKRKKVLYSLIILSVITILATGTMAYFTATQSISNKFKVGGNDAASFSIKVYETNEDGSQTTKGRVYREMLPGKVVKKDPTIENTGKYSQWVRAEVILTSAKSWQETEAKHGIDFKELMGGYDSEKWLLAGETYDQSADERIYTFYLKRELERGEKETLFESFRMPGQLDAEDMTKLREFEIRITATAIQSRGTGDDAETAFKNCYGN